MDKEYKRANDSNNDNEDKSVIAGDDTVVFGNFNHKVVAGNRSVIVGATDNSGNTIISGGTAVGYGAYADSSSVAIGTNAGGGSSQANLIHQIRLIAEESNNPSILAEFRLFLEEYQKPVKNNSMLKSTWENLKNLATVNGLWSLLEKLDKIDLSFLV